MPETPNEINLAIRAKALSEWPDDFEMQMYTIEKQVAAWIDLNKS